MKSILNAVAIVILAANVGLAVHMGNYGLAAFAFCLYIPSLEYFA